MVHVSCSKITSAFTLGFLLQFSWLTVTWWDCTVELHVCNVSVWKRQQIQLTMYSFNTNRSHVTQHPFFAMKDRISPSRKQYRTLIHFSFPKKDRKQLHYENLINSSSLHFIVYWLLIQLFCPCSSRKKPSNLYWIYTKNKVSNFWMA